MIKLVCVTAGCVKLLMWNVAFELVLLQVLPKWEKKSIIVGLANVSRLQGLTEDILLSGYGNIRGKDFLFLPLLLVFNLISNLRHKNGVGVKRQLISVY